MIKKILYKLLPVMLLLLALTAILAASTVTFAEDPDNYSLTVNFDEACSKVWLTVSGESAKEMTSGVPLMIPKASALITLQVELNTGYKISSCQSVLTGQDMPLNASNTRQWALTADEELTLVYEPMVYEIVYLTPAQGDVSYPAGVTRPLTHTFGTATEIPKPIKEGCDFVQWVQLPSEDAESGTALTPISNSDYVTLSAGATPSDGSNKIYLKPILKVKQYEVYCYDRIYNTAAQNNLGDYLTDISDLANVEKWLADYLSTATGADYPAPAYPGFEYFPSDDPSLSVQAVLPSETGVVLNVVYRLYKPLVYELEFLSGYDGAITFPEGSVIPTTHTFDKATGVIPNPTRTGYLFTGWTVTVIKDTAESSFSASPDLTIAARHEAYAGDKDTKIVLTANWKSEEYTVHIDLNTGADTDEYDYSEKYVFENGLTVVDPTRTGYSFAGWLINGGTELLTGVLPAATYTGEITLMAQWTANEYTVTLDPNGGSLVVGTETLPVTFDQALDTSTLMAALPSRVGHKFCGFTLTQNGDDLVIDADGAFLSAAWTIDSDTTLYAKWEVIYYQVSVNFVNAEVYLNGVLYEGIPHSIAYGTEIELSVRTDAGYKVVKFEGEAVSNSAEFTATYSFNRAEDITLTLTVLAVAQTPDFRVDYVAESFTVAGGIPNGNYQILCGDECLSVKVQNGVLMVNGVDSQRVAIPESFFGNRVSIVACGDGVTTADADAVTLTLSARPDRPLMNGAVSGVYSTSTSVSVEFDLTDPNNYLYELALYLDPNGTQLVSDWKSADELGINANGAVTFQNLHPGTYYYIFVRVKASNDEANGYPHGVVNIFQYGTPGEDYKDKMIQELWKLLEDSDGEMTKALIEAAIADIDALPSPSATFYNDLDGIYNAVLAKLEFTRNQDAKIAELQALLAELIATEEFSAESQAQLTALCNNAVAAIEAAQNSGEVLSAADTASRAMKAVKVTYLFFENDMLLTAFDGLKQGTRLFLSRIADIQSLSNAVNNAISLGKVYPADGLDMTLAEVQEALKSLDVLAGYNLRLTENGVTKATDGSFSFKLLLPEALRDATGLQVAYYNETTGMLEVLDTEREGDYLIFRASRVANFVILGDHTVNMTGVVIALGLILLCQLAAIVLLLIRRSKYSKEVRHMSLALPVLLTVRFLPDFAMNAIWIMGGLVILFQIILMYLLLSSEVFYRRKHSSGAHRTPLHEEEPEAPAPAEETKPEAEEEPAPADPATDAAVLALFDDGETLEEGEYESLFAEDPNADSDGEAPSYEADADEYGFIEPAVTARYSLPDEEADADAETESDDAPVFAYDDEEDSLEEDELAEDDVLEEAPEEVYDDETAYAEDDSLDVAQWQYDEAEEDPDLISEETEEAFAEDPVYEEPAFEESYEELPEEPTEPEDTPDVTEDEDGEEPAEEALEEESTEEAPDEEDDEPEFYFEPDARGDDAPAPYDPREH